MEYKIVQIIPTPKETTIEFYINGINHIGHVLCIAMIEDIAGNRRIVPAALAYKTLDEESKTVLPFIEPITEDW